MAADMLILLSSSALVILSFIDAECLSDQVMEEAARFYVPLSELARISHALLRWRYRKIHRLPLDPRQSAKGNLLLYQRREWRGPVGEMGRIGQEEQLGSVH